MRSLQNILVTGGAGFIGSNFIRTLLKKEDAFTGRIILMQVMPQALPIWNPNSAEADTFLFMEISAIKKL